MRSVSLGYAAAVSGAVAGSGGVGESTVASGELASVDDAGVSVLGASLVELLNNDAISDSRP